MLLYIIAAVATISLIHASGSHYPPINAEQQSRATKCAERLFGILDGLASHYCRHRYVATSDNLMGHEYDLYPTLDAIEQLSTCAYGEYIFLYGVLPSPLRKGNAEAGKMLSACLVQQAALRFLQNAPNSIEGADALMCPSKSMSVRVFDPFSQSAPFINNLDFEGMLGFSDRHPCLEAVLSSFAKQALDQIALKKPPQKPSIIEGLQGIKLLVNEYDLNVMPEGIEWPTMLYILKNWNYGQVKGIIIKEGAGDMLPRIVVYYEVRT